MKKMIESMIIAGCMLVALLYMTACSDKLDVQQMYEFDLATLPVQTTIVKGEEAEIRCQLVRNGEYQDTKYFIRYFNRQAKGSFAWRTVRFCCRTTCTCYRKKHSGSITGHLAQTSRK